MGKNNTVRIATVKATGKRYVVQQVDFRSNKVHTWGECVSYKGVAGRFDGAKAFVVDAVDMADVERTTCLMRALWEQGVEAVRAKGYVVRMSRTGRTATIVGKRMSEVAS